MSVTSLRSVVCPVLTSEVDASSPVSSALLDALLDLSGFSFCVASSAISLRALAALLAAFAATRRSAEEGSAGASAALDLLHFCHGCFRIVTDRT